MGLVCGAENAVLASTDSALQTSASSTPHNKNKTTTHLGGCLRESAGARPTIEQTKSPHRRGGVTCLDLFCYCKNKSPHRRCVWEGNIYIHAKREDVCPSLLFIGALATSPPLPKGDLGGISMLFTQKEKAFDLLFCVNPPGLEPGTPTLKVLCSTC